MFFNGIFGQSSILYAILQGRETDYKYGMCKVENFKSFLASIRSDGEFNESYKSAVNKVGPLLLELTRKLITGNCTFNS